MGRGATKAAGNVWYEARMDAAKWNDKLSSRAGAAEALNILTLLSKKGRAKV